VPANIALADRNCIRSPLNRDTVHRSERSDACQHRQPRALLAPTVRVKRNFGLTLESTYLSSWWSTYQPSLQRTQGHALQTTAVCRVGVVLAELVPMGVSGV